MCEAAGFDVVLVETVGVGQSEVAVAGMVDVFLLLLAPGAGDDLQGVKRGIVELADLVVVNKADGALADLARHTASDYGNALHLLRPRTDGWSARVLVVLGAARRGHRRGVGGRRGVHGRSRAASGGLRGAAGRAVARLDVVGGQRDAARAAAPDARVRADLDALEADVVAGRTSPTAAARLLLDRFCRFGLSWPCGSARAASVRAAGLAEDLAGLRDPEASDRPCALVELPVGPRSAATATIRRAATAAGCR